MNFNEYQELTQKTAAYPKIGASYVYPTLGLVGEAGEVAEKVKKIFRDNDGVLDEAKKNDLQHELGDVLWYLSQIAVEMDLSLEDIAIANIEKLASRQQREVIGGEGDNR